MDKIGFDIGGTKIEAILWDGRKIKATFSAKTPKTKKEFVAIMKKATEKIFKENKEISIGIGAAGVIGKDRVIFSPNVPYLKNFNFGDIFPKASIKIDNDARAFLRGELENLKREKRDKSNERVLALTIGTGIGRAFAEGGKVKKVKKLEYPEKWEKEYQSVRDYKNTADLVKYLSKKIMVIARGYKPKIVIIGGGILRRENFFQYLKSALSKGLKKYRIDAKIQKAKLENSAPLGAALLF